MSYFMSEETETRLRCLAQGHTHLRRLISLVLFLSRPGRGVLLGPSGQRCCSASCSAWGRATNDLAQHGDEGEKPWAVLQRLPAPPAPALLTHTAVLWVPQIPGTLV